MSRAPFLVIRRPESLPCSLLSCFAQTEFCEVFASPWFAQVNDVRRNFIVGCRFFPLRSYSFPVYLFPCSNTRSYSLVPPCHLFTEHRQSLSNFLPRNVTPWVFSKNQKLSGNDTPVVVATYFIEILRCSKNKINELK